MNSVVDLSLHPAFQGRVFLVVYFPIQLRTSNRLFAKKWFSSHETSFIRCNFAGLQNRVIAFGNNGGKSGQHRAAHYLTGRSPACKRVGEQTVPQKITVPPTAG